jgi:hypothetical protein
MIVFCRLSTGFRIQETPPTSGTRFAPLRLHDTQVLLLVDERPASSPLFNIRPSRHRFHVPLLKSNLQKAIRRRNRDAALRTAWWLLCNDPTELLRRLPVIICEDTQLEPQTFVELVWLMAAVSKGYRLLWSDAALVMAVVATALETTGHWNLEVSGPSLPAGGLLQNPVALALHVRIAFGGMRGDMAFLGRLRDRVVAGTLPLWMGSPVWLEEDIPWLDPEEDILLEAVDQHVYPRLAEAVSGLQLEAVWFCRSSVNVRSYVGEGAAEAEAAWGAKRDALQPNLEKHALPLELFSRRMRRRADRVTVTEVADMTAATVATVTTLDRWFVKR